MHMETRKSEDSLYKGHNMEVYTLKNNSGYHLEEKCYIILTFLQ